MSTVTGWAGPWCWPASTGWPTRASRSACCTSSGTTLRLCGCTERSGSPSISPIGGGAEPSEAGAPSSLGDVPTLYDLGRADLEDLLADQPRYRVDQVWQGLYEQAAELDPDTGAP